MLDNNDMWAITLLSIGFAFITLLFFSDMSLVILVSLISPILLSFMFSFANNTNQILKEREDIFYDKSKYSY